MMVQIVSNWRFAIDRGPDCLFVKIQPPKHSAKGADELADDLWSIMVKHLTYRLVLEMEEVDRLPDHLIQQLLTLKQRIESHGGMLRLCGLSDSCQETLDTAHTTELAKYHNRTDALVGHHLAASDVDAHKHR
ncbi:MAG: hypothetical protein ACC645_11130 [Pirellulales bacterium]